jgi:hypothetical protein
MQKPSENIWKGIWWMGGSKYQTTERGIKPFVIGRKNWIFSNTPNFS